jgi:metal-responsive CopG/Arc/MetJ family transcriptional regulator
VAKVMISLPDELLARLDAVAEREGTSRSAVIRELAGEALEERAARLAARMRELNRRSRGHGGGVVRELKAGRRR